jgi:hypothetical protein
MATDPIRSLEPDLLGELLDRLALEHHKALSAHRQGSAYENMSHEFRQRLGVEECMSETWS